MPDRGLVCDLLWSDPDEKQTGFQPSPRMAGYLFGCEATRQFLHSNNLTKVVRAHQLVMQGFQHNHQETVMTLFSAPNYCYRSGNLAAVIEVRDDMLLSLTQFSQIASDNDPHVCSMLPECFLDD
jgi:serine/threonine-protein phosphatase 2A catalytic subunit